MTLEESVALFRDDKFAIELSHDENELDTLANLLEDRGFEGFDDLGVREYIDECLGERGWPFICMTDNRREIQGCGREYVRIHFDGNVYSINEFLCGYIDNDGQAPADDFNDVFTEV